MIITGNVTELANAQVFILLTTHSDQKSEGVRDCVIEAFARKGDTVLHELGEELDLPDGIQKKSWYDPKVAQKHLGVQKIANAVEKASVRDLKKVFDRNLPPNFVGDIRALARRSVQLLVDQTCEKTFTCNQDYLLGQIKSHLPTGNERLFVSMGRWHGGDPRLFVQLQRSNVNYVIINP